MQRSGTVAEVERLGIIGIGSVAGGGGRGALAGRIRRRVCTRQKQLHEMAIDELHKLAFAWFNARDLDPAHDYIAIIQSSRGHVIFIDPPCDIRDMFNSSRPICAAQGPSVLLRVASVSALIACVWYAACWSIGWVLAGFARDEANIRNRQRSAKFGPLNFQR